MPPLRLFDLALSADLIIEGQCSQIGSDYIYIRTKDRLPKSRNGMIRLDKAPSLRIDSMLVAQRAYYFVKADKDGYQLVGGSKEAILPILKDSVPIPLQYFGTEIAKIALNAPKTDLFPITRLKYAQGERTFIALQLHQKDFQQSVHQLRECYQIILKNDTSMASNACFNFFDRYAKSKSYAIMRKWKLMELLYKDMELAQKNNCAPNALP